MRTRADGKEYRLIKKYLRTYVRFSARLRRLRQLLDAARTPWCVRTYKEGFAETYKKKSQKGKASLRRLQFKHAETNPTMAIWLGKQLLGQRDQMEVEASGKVTIVDDIPDAATEK